MFHRIRHQPLPSKAVELLSAAGFPYPTEIQERVFWFSSSSRSIIVECSNENEKILSFLIPILTESESIKERPNALVLVDNENEIVKIKRILDLFKSSFPEGFWIFVMDSENILKELPLLSKSPAIIIGTTNHIIDHIRRKNVILQYIRTLIVDITGDSERDVFDKNVLFISTKLSRKVHVSIFLNNFGTLNHLKGISKRPVFMLESPKKRGIKNNPESNLQEMKVMAKLDEEQVKKQIEQFISVIKSSEDPLLLKEYKKIIKKSVPFHLRGYFHAYTFKTLVSGSTSTAPTIAGNSFKNKKKPEDVQTLFINIGKTRRVYPKDLLKFFQSSLDITPEKIGSIKVLANYSFVDIDREVAAKAVEVMDGSLFRGKKIIVNFARQKEA